MSLLSGEFLFVYACNLAGSWWTHPFTALEFPVSAKSGRAIGRAKCPKHSLHTRTHTHTHTHTLSICSNVCQMGPSDGRAEGWADMISCFTHSSNAEIFAPSLHCTLLSPINQTQTHTHAQNVLSLRHFPQLPLWLTWEQLNHRFPHWRHIKDFNLQLEKVRPS